MGLIPHAFPNLFESRPRAKVRTVDQPIDDFGNAPSAKTCHRMCGLAEPADEAGCASSLLSDSLKNILQSRAITSAG
jgi:hypothetical protein